MVAQPGTLTHARAVIGSAQPGCSDWAARFGECPNVNEDDDEVVVTGWEQHDGDDPRQDHRRWNDEERYQPPERRTREECAENWQRMLFCFEKRNKNDDENDDEPRTPDFNITDVARFAPAPSKITGEPDNVGVAGLAANFVSTAETQVTEGELFDFPISARFTPVTYTFHYGDGSSKSSATGGATWDALKQAQFTATSTSHAYAERGTYTARVDVSYTAEIGFAGRWFPLTGQLTIDGANQSIRIYEAKTALVARTCDEQPTSPGC